MCMGDPTVLRLADRLGAQLLRAFRPQGVYVMDEQECATRRVDLDAPYDEDPGPIALGPVEDDAEDSAIVLTFGE